MDSLIHLCYSVCVLRGVYLLACVLICILSSQLEVWSLGFFFQSAEIYDAKNLHPNGCF